MAYKLTEAPNLRFSSPQAVQNYINNLPTEARKRLSIQTKNTYGVKASGELGGGGGGLSDYISRLEAQSEEARAANLQRYEEMMNIYNQIVEQYSPAGTFMTGAKAELEATKKRDVSSAIAQTVSSGLFGTSIPGTAATKWEQEVGQPSRLKLEDIRTERYASALAQKAGAIERREDEYPDYSTMANLIAQASSAGSSSSYAGNYSAQVSSSPEYAFGSAAYAKKQSDEAARRASWQKVVNSWRK